MGEPPMKDNQRMTASTQADAPESSNAVYLTGRQWVGVGLFALALVVFAPPLWKVVEKFDPDADYRMPYDQSNDYWLYERYTYLAAARYDTLLIGDSVVWGHYVTREQTLSHYLNEQAGRERFANLGLDGTHPLALAGLLEHYAGGVRGKEVVLQWNPLWMSSPKTDLRDEKATVNHPRLVPQFTPRIPAYQEEYSTRLGVVIEQHVPFSSWTTHLQQAYFDRSDIPSWTLEHPYDNPLEQLAQGLPPSDNLLREEPISWKERGIRKQAYPWVDPETSLQWRAFRRAVEILERRGNRVFVLLGPFNEHHLTDNNRREYHKVKATVEDWLRERGIAYAAPPPLPTDYYADASHPLGEGYALLARELFGQLAP